MEIETLEELLRSSSVEALYEAAQLYVREVMKHGKNSDIYDKIVGRVGLNYASRHSEEGPVPFAAYAVVITAVGAGKTLEEVEGLLGWLGFKQSEGQPQQ